MYHNLSDYFAENGATNGIDKQLELELNGIGRELDELDLAGKHRAVTGVLASHAQGRDVDIINASITFHGTEMLVDTQIKLNIGNRYGLIGPNGCGMYSNYM